MRKHLSLLGILFFITSLAHAVSVTLGKSGGGNGTTNVNIYTGTTPVAGADEGAYITNIATINCVGAGVTCTDGGNGIFTMTIPGGSVGTAGGSSIAIGTGSAQAVNNISSNVVVSITFSSAIFKVSLVGATSNFITIDFSTWDATYVKVQDWNIAKATVTSGGGGSGLFDNFKATGVITAQSGVDASSITVFGKSTLMDTLTSTAGANMAGSTFTSISLPPGVSGNTDAVLHFGNPSKTGIYQQEFFTGDIDFKSLGKNILFIYSGGLEVPIHGNYHSDRSSGSLYANYSVGSAVGKSGLYRAIPAGLDIAGINYQNLPVVEFPGYIQSISSIGAWGVIGSSVGFIAPSSTFTLFNLSGGTFCVKDGAFCLVFDSAPLAAGQKLGITSVAGAYYHIGGVGDQSGAAGGGITTDQANALINNSTPTIMAIASTASAQAYNTALTTGTAFSAFSAFRSTSDTKLDGAYTAINSTWTNLGASTQAVQNFVSAYTSTSDARGNTFVNFRSTSDTNFNTLNSTMMAIVKSTTSLEIKMATATLVFNGGVALTAFVQGANITLTQNGSSLTIAGGGGAGQTADQVNAAIVSTWNALASFPIGVGFNGSGSALAISSSEIVTIPYAGVITSFTITAPWQTGEARVRIAKAPSYGTLGTASWTDICTAQCPSLSGTNQRVVDSVLGGFTTAVAANDNFVFSLDSAAVSIQSLTVQLNVRRQ